MYDIIINRKTGLVTKTTLIDKMIRAEFIAPLLFGKMGGSEHKEVADENTDGNRQAAI